LRVAALESGLKNTLSKWPDTAWAGRYFEQIFMIPRKGKNLVLNELDTILMKFKNS